MNYDKLMQNEIESLKKGGGDRPPRLLLHACCAPCSSACLERLWQSFEVTVFYFNPNIDDETEYRARFIEEKRLIDEFNRRLDSGDCEGLMFYKEGPRPNRIGLIEGEYRTETFYEAVKGLEAEPEGGARCGVCFELRLKEAARAAKEGGFDLFTTTLTISPLKDAERLNSIGERIAGEVGVRFLPSDFKKRDGYRRSVELSGEFDLYRQNYCGCSFSKNLIN